MNYDNDLINKGTQFIDMASTANATKEFFGKEEEDVGLWLREIKMTARVVNLNEEQQTRLILFKLRGTAQTWAATNFNSSDTITLSDVTSGLIKRFSNAKNKMEKLKNFMAIKTTKNREDLNKMTELATFLIANRYMDAEPTIKLTILKCPPEIRSILYQATYEEFNWNNFLRALDNVSWLAFPEDANEVSQFNREEEVRAVRTSKTKSNRRSKDTKKGNIGYGGSKKQEGYCIIHGECQHLTKECWTFKKITENGYDITKKRPRSIKTVQEKEENSSEELNDKHLYSNFQSKGSSNPFE
ncbi:MAG: hypothetical protein ACRCX1_00945 [Bacteroidales bacterium]